MGVEKIDSALREIVPDYVKRLEREWEEMDSALKKSDFLTIGRIGHNWKGSGGGYGLHQISEIGLGLEKAAPAKDAVSVAALIAQGQTYLRELEIEYVD